MDGAIWILVPLVWAPIVLVLAVRGMRHEERKMEMKLRLKNGDVEGKFAAANASLEAEVVRLRDRVSVLERLVLDDDRRLSAEIDQLRRPQSSV